MKKNFARFLALRYLKPKRTSVSIITLLCVAGVTLGVWILVVVMSVMLGFEKRTKELLLGFEYHVFVEQKPSPRSSAYPMRDWRPLLDQIKTTPGVKATSPVVEGIVLVDGNGMRIGQRMRGVEEGDSHVLEEIKLEEGSLASDNPDVQPVVVSDAVMLSLGLNLGQTVDVYSQAHFDKVYEAINDAKNPRLSGTFGESINTAIKGLQENSTIIDDQEPELTVITRDAVASAIAALEPILDTTLEKKLKPSEREIVGNAHFFLTQLGAPQDNALTYDRNQLNQALQPLHEIANLPAQSEEDDEQAFAQLEELVLPKQLSVTGWYKQPPHVNAPSMLMPLFLSQELYGFSELDLVHSIGIRIEDAYQADQFAEQLQQSLPPGFYASSWITRNEDVFFALANERRMMYFALFCIMVVASFCIMVTMITVTVEKRREIGVMKALGATAAQIVSVFAVQGVVVGIIGSLSGLGLGLLTLYFRDQVQAALGLIGMDPFPAAVYGLERIPAAIDPVSLTIIGFGAFLLCSLAALPPAWSVARLDPAKALRD
ncbi:FtsX-like permease family protein [Sulfuriroseicoccus oceanibius]|uniref:ABC transporter permease n=1 Tax=Sulfuriroseicoccus oceanibius TaxID=2707525 RepID=A0A6B3LAM9_9BACT|nr:FtsX-like permease family protein [Sulfuriroseicoccus oceanibius]QQL45555.1 ABC transporter permease [Sulfuriroseicoccus oceanibius]